MRLLPCPPLPPAWVPESLAAGAYYESFPTLKKDKRRTPFSFAMWTLVPPQSPIMLSVSGAQSPCRVVVSLSVYGIKNSTKNSVLCPQSASVSLLSHPPNRSSSFLSPSPTFCPQWSSSPRVDSPGRRPSRLHHLHTPYSLSLFQGTRLGMWRWRQWRGRGIAAGLGTGLGIDG